MTSHKYTISLESELTPAQWFFHVRNIQDNANEQGYLMQDDCDRDEVGRLSVLGSSGSSQLKGTIAGAKPLSPHALRQLIDEYINSRKFDISVMDVGLRKSQYLVEWPMKDNRQPSHYSIVFKPSMAAANWFVHVRNLADFMAPLGYKLEDFRDGYILDRQTILTDGPHDCFEGFARSNLLFDPAALEPHVSQYLAHHGLEFVSCTT
jgi:hypothetical protein